VGIRHLRTRQIVALSGGELARVLLARAIAGKPELLILDEPLAGVDVAGEAALYHLIAEFRDEFGCAVLLVSHDLHVVMAQADRVVCLNGHVCCEGKAEQVVRDPAFAQLFGPRVASELALYVHRHDHSHAGNGHG
jgi:zinc transport system ATP-binding protein